MKTIRQLVLVACIAACVGSVGFGQDAPGAPDAKANADGASPLGVRQDGVRRMVDEMEAKFEKLAAVLRDTEPERAVRLQDALTASREQRIRDRMDRIQKMLDEGNLDQAKAEQEKIVIDLAAMVDILTDDGDLDELLDEADQLERFRDRIDDLIQRETDLRGETDNLQNKDGKLASLDAQIAALKDVIAKQAAARAGAAEARTQGLRAMANAAAEQAKVRRETGDLLDKMIEAAKPAGQGQPGEGQPGEGQAGEGQPGEGQPGEGQPGQQGQPGQKGEPKGAGAKPLSKAIEHQRQAERDLDKGKGRGAVAEQDEAVKQLNKALEELEKERARIARLELDKDADRLADEQDRTADKADELSRDMKEAGESQPGQPGEGQPGEGQPGEGQSGQAQAGGQQVAKAQKKMQQAAKNLRNKDTEQAGKNQDEAINELAKAKEDVEERLRQLREDMQEEILAALEQRFRQMLERQIPVTEMTAGLEKLRARAPVGSDGKRQLTRTQKVKLKQLAEEERALAEMARQAMRIITEDGTTVVFPRIVSGLTEDLETTAEFLGRDQTGQYTQQLQVEIERTLKELIEALERAQEVAEGQSGEAQDPGEMDTPLPPLVPGSAELKLLKSAQLRVNRRTESFDKARPADTLTQPLRREVHRISDRQDEVREMAIEMSEGPN